MKKIFVVLALLLSFCAFADEKSNQNIINSSIKPTDEEIKATLEKYDFDKKQKEVLFKQMKKQIDDMYDTSENNCELNPVVEPTGGIIENYTKDMQIPKQ